MRLWSLHPRHLDTRALVACWREGLLAYHVLRGMTKGYKNHPQLDRFKMCTDPITSLEGYLHGICDEADIRGYHFDRSKLRGMTPFVKGGRGDFSQELKSSVAIATAPFQKELIKIPLTQGQLIYELEHLRKKILERSPKEIHRLERNIDPHPIFTLIEGEVEEWERA